jgi:hypothetical protein
VLSKLDEIASPDTKARVLISGRVVSHEIIERQRRRYKNHSSVSQRKTGKGISFQDNMPALANIFQSNTLLIYKV